MNILNKKIDWTNPEEKKRYQRKWWHLNKDRLLAKGRDYKKDNKEMIKIKSKEYYEKNKERLRSAKNIYHKKWRRQNKQKIAEANKNYKSRPEIKKKILAQEKKRYEDKKKNICLVCGGKAHIEYCSCECRAQDRVGEKHHNWQGGKSFEPYDRNWNNKFKKSIRERDGNMCMICNRHRDEFKRALDVHHIDGDKLNTIEKNCVSLCQRHHMIIEASGSKKFTFWMPKFQKMLSKLYAYKYKREGCKLRW